MTLEDHLAEFPFSVFIPHFDSAATDRAVAMRHEWLRSIPGRYEKFDNGPFGWHYGENVGSIYRAGPNEPWQYIFKDLSTAIEFKLRFG